jgi:hypothetical protein
MGAPITQEPHHKRFQENSMRNTQSRIEEPVIERDATGKIIRSRQVFGPHHFLEVYLRDGRVQCAIGATHHGITADAADVNSDLERFTEELQGLHPDKAF